MGRFDALTQLDESTEKKAPLPVAPPPKTTNPAVQSPIKKPRQEKKPVTPVKKEIAPDIMIPRHHDTMIPRHQETMTPEEETDILEVVRRAVKQIGKEAATYRFTLEEKNHLTDIKYTYKRQGVITSEVEITRIATNYFIEDYRQNGEESLLAKIIKRLNS